MITFFDGLVRLLGLGVIGWWLLSFVLSFRERRPDGVAIMVPAIRRLMFHILPGRTESVVMVDTVVDASALESYLEHARPRLGANLTHAVVAATNVCLGANPRLNRFTSGGRLYARRGRWLTFSMKRGVGEQGRVDRGSGLATVKIPMIDGESFAQLCTRINADIRLQRSGAETPADKEYKLFDRLPTAVLGLAAPLVRWLDAKNLLPAFFIEGDGLFASAFVANLGSLGMGAGYHHLFEYGNCPVFLVVGAVEERAVVVDGNVVVRRQLPLRFTFDERIEDASNARHALAAMRRVLEEPERWLGCLAQDGSDTVPLWPRTDWASEDGRFNVRN